jgi:hypothetical protein
LVLQGITYILVENHSLYLLINELAINELT